VKFFNNSKTNEDIATRFEQEYALKANITEEIPAVTADVLARTFQNIARRVQSCLDANGGHFQHML